jgi:hypothetical protein
MSNILRRIEIPIFITIICTLIQVIPYYVYIQPLDDAAAYIQRWILICLALATFVGVISLLLTHGKNLQKRSKGWYFSAIVVVFTIVMSIVGLPLAEVGLGAANPIYLFLYNNMLQPLSGTMYAIIAFFIAAAAFRAFRARNVEASIVLIAGILMVCSNAPLFTVFWPPFKTIGTWIFAVPNMATNRAITIGAALGLVALAVRTLMGIERGYLRGGGAEQ